MERQLSVPGGSLLFAWVRRLDIRFNMMQLEIRKIASSEYKLKEAINTLCTNLLLYDDDAKVIMVTSCFPQEGKSTVSFELTRTIGDLGKRVILIDADIRASCLMEEYDINMAPGSKTPFRGLSRYLSGGCRAEEIIGETNLKNVSMILGGRNVINSLPLLSSDRMGALMNIVKGMYDIIIVDTPPIGTIIDAAKIARHCDGALLVVKSGKVKRKELAEAMKQMERTGCPIFGTVLNAYAEEEKGSREYYREYYSPLEEEEKKKKRKSKK